MWVVYTRASSNTKIISRLISFFTKKKKQKLKSTPSHMQMVFGKRFSLESVGGTGVKIGFFPNSVKTNQVLSIFEYKDAKQKDGILLAKGAFKYHGLKYDYRAIIVFAYYIVRQKLFGYKIPLVNKIDNPNRFFCSEMMEFIDETSFRSLDPNSQMLDLYDKPEKFELIYDHEIHGAFDVWFKEEFSALQALIDD